MEHQRQGGKALNAEREMVDMLDGQGSQSGGWGWISGTLWIWQSRGTLHPPTHALQCPCLTMVGWGGTGQGESLLQTPAGLYKPDSPPLQCCVGLQKAVSPFISYRSLIPRELSSIIYEASSGARNPPTPTSSGVIPSIADFEKCLAVSQSAV